MPLLGEIFNSKGMSQPLFNTNNSITARRFWWTGAIPYYGGWYKWDLVKKHNPSGATTFGIGVIVFEAWYTWTA
jgi:hypothetical protein